MATRSRPVLMPLTMLLLVGAGLLSSAAAKFAIGEPVPVERLLQNLDAFEKDHPDNAKAHYLRARIHAYAFQLKTDILRQHKWAADGLPFSLDENYPLGYNPGEKEKPAPLTDAQLEDHLANAIASYRKAISIAPNDGRAHLGLAYVLNIGRNIAPVIGSRQGVAAKAHVDMVLNTIAQVKKLDSENTDERDAAEAELLKIGGAALEPARNTLIKKGEISDRNKRLLASLWREEAIEEYRLAWKLSIATDKNLDHILHEPPAMEALQAYIALTSERPLREGEAAVVGEAKADLKMFNSKGRAETPIIFSLEKSSALPALLDPQKRVRFDIAGDDITRDWEWVKPCTCILVWDPHHDGNVTSGRQLFGSATWWMFFENGFQALEALDDNRDGVLSGDELSGIAVWRDANGNGVSDKGEVIPIEETQIDSLSVHAESTVDERGSLAHSSGLRLKDGRELPLYDWISAGSPLPETRK